MTAGRRARAGGKKSRQRRALSPARPTPAEQDHDALYVRHIVWIEANLHLQSPLLNETNARPEKEFCRAVPRGSRRRCRRVKRQRRGANGGGGKETDRPAAKPFQRLVSPSSSRNRT